ncbi:MAG TPA: alpha/beta fold hydrolase [Blastocatellia bacterium]|nr:alpha/beta fold hydrolase [Blastocatellia bacterium]
MGFLLMKQEVDCWFRSGSARGLVELNLFCFPYAGGTAMVYRDWSARLPPSVRVMAVEMPGRGNRLKEPPFTSMSTLVAALAEVIKPLLDVPFVFFGHSMGAIIAFELAKRLRSDRNCEPRLLVVSGRRAPQIPDSKPIKYDLPKEEFMEELRRIDGTPKEVLEHAELMELMLPLLRADFQLIRTYQYTADTRLRCPISAYGGLEDDEETRELMLPWREQTNSAFVLRMVPGAHFFLRSSQSHLLGSLARELDDLTRGSGETSATA